MKRTKVAAFFYCCNYSIVNQYRTAELSSSMKNAMTYCIDFIQRFYGSVFRVSQRFKNKLYTGCVFLNISFQGFSFHRWEVLFSRMIPED